MGGLRDGDDGDAVSRYKANRVEVSSMRYVSRVCEEEEEEEEFITSGNWGGKHNSLSRSAGADPP